jgi:Ca2+-binding EF-hand superfamily protein
MEKYKEICNDPAKLEAALKDAWAKIDAKGEGAVTHEQFKVAAEEMAKTMNLPGMKPPTEEEKAAAKKIADPNDTGKITFEGFKALVQAGIAKGRKEGKI